MIGQKFIILNELKDLENKKNHGKTIDLTYSHIFFGFVILGLSLYGTFL